jgi:glucosyl-3-phosphoglycerate synthase
VHFNQPTRALGRMAFGILRSFLRRLSEQHNLENLPDLETTLRQFQFVENHFEQVPYDIQEEERPPMITIPEYREKRGITE